MKILGRLLLGLVLLVVVAAAVVYRYPLWLATEHTRYTLWRAGVKSRSVAVDGNQIHYFEAAATDGSAGTPLLLVHGIGARAEDWAPMIPAFAARGFHVYVPDLLGYGRSAHPDIRYSISEEEQMVADYLQTVQVPHADVIGWSMGGWIAAKLTLDHPRVVDRLVLYDSAGIRFAADYDATLFTPDTVEGLDRLVARLSPKPVKVPHFIAEAALRRLQANAWVLRRNLQSMLGGADLLDDRLQNLSKPTLIVWGAQDDLIPVTTGEAMHRLIPGSILAIEPGCGHLAPAQCTAPILAATARFLRATPPIQGGETMLPPAKQSR